MRRRGSEPHAADDGTAIGWRQPGATAVERILRRANRELMCAIKASLLDGR
jgi:hypothetical protein